jgi:hypothetical protein
MLGIERSFKLNGKSNDMKMPAPNKRFHARGGVTLPTVLRVNKKVLPLWLELFAPLLQVKPPER